MKLALVSCETLPGHEIDDQDALVSELTGHVALDRLLITPRTPKPRIDQSVLNELHKLGGKVAEIIDAHRTSSRGESTLTIEPKEEVTS